MPLPAEGSTWPPKALDPVTSQLAVWSAWYSSGTDTLSGIYGGDLAGNVAHAPGTDAMRNDRRGRIAATLARWFWGTKTPQNERRTKLHLPVARDIAATSSDILFGEPLTLQVEDSAAQDRLDELTGLDLRATLAESGELAAGMGGIYQRIVWDREVRDRPWLSAVHADSAVPEWRWNVLVAVTFWREVETDGNTVIRHLERHEQAAILNGLYKGSRTDLGKSIPLDSDPATAGLSEVVPTGLPPGRLTASYVPNIVPAPGWRHVPAAANLGRADFDGTEPLMDALDETYSSLMRDIRLGRARIHVPSPYLTSLGPGKGAMWEDREMYAGFEILGASGLDAGLQIHAYQANIRVEEHLRTAGDLLERIVAASGYSAQTFGLAGEDGADMTATEVSARRGRTGATRAKKMNHWAPRLADLAESLMMIDRTVFGGSYTVERPDVEFGQAPESPRILAETLNLLTQAAAASTETKVRLLHPDWDDVRVKQEVDGIREDAGGGFDPIERATSALRAGTAGAPAKDGPPAE